MLKGDNGGKESIVKLRPCFVVNVQNLALSSR